MIKWWNHKYPFRRTMNFENLDQTIEVNHPLVFLLPKTIETQGKFNSTISNLEIIYQDREIAKPIEYSIVENTNDYTISFPNFREIKPFESIDSYKLYYGANVEDILGLDPYEPLSTGFIVISDMRSNLLGFSNIEEDWTFLTHNGKTYALTKTPDAKVTLTGYANKFYIKYLSLPSTGSFSYQLNDEEPNEISSTYQLGSQVIEESNIVVSNLIIEADSESLSSIRLKNLNESIESTAPISDYDGLVLGDLSGFNELIEYLDDNYRENIMGIKEISFDRHNVLILKDEEVDETLAWSTTLGSAINVQ